MEKEVENIYKELKKENRWKDIGLLIFAITMLSIIWTFGIWGAQKIIPWPLIVHLVLFSAVVGSAGVWTVLAVRNNSRDRIEKRLQAMNLPSDGLEIAKEVFAKYSYWWIYRLITGMAIALGIAGIINYFLLI